MSRTADPSVPVETPDEHVEKIHEAESYVEEVEQTRERMRVVARGELGITGSKEKAPPLRETMRSADTGWYPLVALGVLVIVDQFQSFAFFVLGPEISRSLGLSRAALGGLVSLKTLAFTLATLPMAAYVQKKARRGLVSIITAFAWSVMTLFTGFVTNTWQMLLVLVGDGISTGSTETVHPPLLMDTYPPEGRMRVLTYYRSLAEFGSIVSPLLVGLLTAVLGLTWRGVFLVMGITSLLSAFFAIRLRDPGFGRWDSARIRQKVRESSGSEAEEVIEDEQIALGFFEIVRRLLMIPTIRRIMAGFAVQGMLIVPLNTFLFFFLEERWGMGPGARAVFFACLPLFAITTLSIWGKRGEEIFRQNPIRILDIVALFLSVGVVFIALAMFSPSFPLMVGLFGIAIGLFAVINTGISLVMLSIVPSRMRPHASALAGIAAAAIGGFGGLLLLSGIDRRFGAGGAIATLAIPGFIAALILRSAGRTLNADLDRMVDEIVEEEELRGLSQRGVRLPMLACRHIDFSYGQLQVLFDVNFTVDDGEIVALLGTNGAGKSTLLKVISGLGLPSRGSVNFRGHDISYLDAERRLRLGITQIPGGRAVFGPLTVVENMRLFGYTHGRDRAAMDRGIEASFEAFPRLAERRNQAASTLSGGEQQMLGLAKAFILQPRLLLIDELSLGLAPKIIGELLEMVRRINASGTAVVLVEQSVNIALSIVEHAYFMEKGQVRFDGPARDLLERPDLLRSVFLEGATKGLAQDGATKA